MQVPERHSEVDLDHLSGPLLGATVQVVADQDPPGPPPDLPLVQGAPAGGRLPAAEDASTPFALVWADSRRAVLHFPEIGWFEVVDGASIRVTPARPLDVEGVRTVLSGAATAFLLGQQGRFALHASVIDLSGVRIVLTGYAGAGKSTSAAALDAAGSELVVDDVAVLDVEGSEVVVEPFGRPLHLCPDAADRLGLDHVGARTMSAGSSKLVVELPRTVATSVHAVVVLGVADTTTAPDEVHVERLETIRALRAVRDQTLRSSTVCMLWPEASFAWHAALVTALPVHRLLRPSARWALEEVVGRVRLIADRL